MGRAAWPALRGPARVLLTSRATGRHADSNVSMSIQQKQSHQSHEAVMFFASGDVDKEMLYTEFEALLDCVVPMRDFAGRSLEAAYVRFDEHLNILAVVLFQVPFTEDGFPDALWNLPLRQLADAGTRGPDLGGGPVRLATASQCPLARYQELLWDVRFDGLGNTLSQIQDRLRSNRLGIDVADMASVQRAAPAAWPAAAAPPAAAPGGGSAEDAAAMMAFMQQSGQQLAQQREQHQREMQALQGQLAALAGGNRELQAETLALQQQLQQQADALAHEQQLAAQRVQQVLEKARAQFGVQKREAEAALAAVRREHAAAVAALEAGQATALAGLQANHDAALEALRAQAAHESQLQENEIQSLRAELTELRRDKRRLLGEGADKFFATLKEKGVKFVSFQPGAGHLTIPMEDLYRFVDATEAYVAEKCQVNVDLYRRWLAHYNSPVCGGTAGNGGPCAKPVTKLLKPAEFVPGVHDRCDIHKQIPRQPSARGASA